MQRMPGGTTTCCDYLCEDAQRQPHAAPGAGSWKAVEAIRTRRPSAGLGDQVVAIPTAMRTANAATSTTHVFFFMKVTTVALPRYFGSDDKLTLQITIDKRIY